MFSLFVLNNKAFLKEKMCWLKESTFFSSSSIERHEYWWSEPGWSDPGVTSLTDHNQCMKWPGSACNRTPEQRKNVRKAVPMMHHSPACSGCFSSSSPLTITPFGEEVRSGPASWTVPARVDVRRLRSCCAPVFARTAPVLPVQLRICCSQGGCILLVRACMSARAFSSWWWWSRSVAFDTSFLCRGRAQSAAFMLLNGVQQRHLAPNQGKRRGQKMK